MLDQRTIKKIESFVYTKPRSVQEIASHLGKNWRTIDRYISEIEREHGTISSRVFRSGTRGALKVVYWASVEKIKGSVFQEEIEKQIFQGMKKEDFSAFDIFQHIDDNKKETEVVSGNDETDSGLIGLQKIIRAAKKQMLIFSGNLSFMDFRNDRVNTLYEIEEAVKRNVSIKVVTRVEVGSKENIENLLSLNSKYGKDLVEIRHSKQPLRAIIVDKSFFNIKEIKKPTRRGEGLTNKLFIFYTIKDIEWIDWLTRIFWKMFSSSIGANKRLEEISKIKFQRRLTPIHKIL